MVKSNIVIKYQINILVGIWEINNEIVINIKAENKLHILGVCNIHYNHNQNTFYDQKLKKQRLIKKSWVYHHQYLFYNKYKYFFSYGNNCLQYSVCIAKRNIQALCVGLKVCPVFNINYTEDSIIKKSVNEYRTRYICSECFNSQDEHFYECYDSKKKPFSCNNKHENNTKETLKLFEKWI